MAEKPNEGQWGNPEVSNSRKPLVPKSNCHRSPGNAAWESRAFYNPEWRPATVGLHLKVSRASASKGGLAYGIIKGRRTLRTGMHAIDVKTTKLLLFIKFLELSNRRKKKWIIDLSIINSYLWTWNPFLNTYTCMQFFSSFDVQSFSSSLYF